MKKLFAMLLAGLMLASVMSVVAFGVDLPDISEYAPEDGVTFYALIISTGTSKNGKGFANICGFNSNDINHRGLYTASFSEDVEILNADGDITIDDLRQGDIVAITYSGEALDLYPGQLLGTTRVYVIDHVDTFAEISSLIPDGYEDYGDYIPAWNDFVAKLAELDYSVSDGKVTLSWDKIEDETYTVYWKRSSSDEWKVACETSKHKVNIIGLKSGVSYDFKVEILGQDSEVVTATAE
ncbi:MAG: fibronectin type III domain-containing protein [Oscillospiraceae bacterium]|nr:fibronectin type III domain-containing protein [Oscillospiraceae bacterium]